MYSKELYENYVLILKSELIEALGCTEPIAIAYASAKARSVLGKEPEEIEVGCSGNIVKNVKGVVVPNTGGLIGIGAAAIAGVIGGDADKGLQVLESVKREQYGIIKELAKGDYCKVYHLQGVEKLYIKAKVYAGNESAEVYIEGSHTNIVKIVKNGKVIFENENGDRMAPESAGDKTLLNIKDIIEFAEAVDLEALRELLSRQVKVNTAIAEEGIKNEYGVGVGKTLLKYYGNDVAVRARAMAAAGSDARMSGCSLPVVINSGSGNQGITVSLPVIEYARELKVSEEKLFRALIISNLTSIHQKAQIGNLSAYCGAVSAAAGSGAGIAYLNGGGYEEISRTIINTIGNIGGMVCDGAKPSCAAKISSAVGAAILGYQLSKQGKAFRNGEGLVKNGVEETISSFGRLGKKGMEGTDNEIIGIMLDR
ncbi:MAG: L-serine ammonia-lyase, iron-sulfur-dependent, subunit alpha [Clostridiaceae bacterium]|jgi:L-cysteine desulfidase|nr:L-serine ammonia-lyase, iron-sulfur-dependent, subunit alpha [Clostridiaceae bacterium]